MAVTEEESSSTPSSSAAPSHGPSSTTSGAVHFLAKSLVRSGVILQVARGRFRSPDSADIVFGKETSIELLIMGDDGIVQSVCEQPVFGMIKDLAVLPWQSKSREHIEMSRKDLLVVLSDSAKLSFLSFSKEMHRFFAVTHVQLSDVGKMLAVDSSGSFVAVGSYEKQVTLFSMSTCYSDDVVDKRITYPPEGDEDAVTRRTQKTWVSGTKWSMCFIADKLSQSSKEHSPILAIVLTRKGSFLNTLLLLRWLVKENSFQVLSQYLETGPLAFTVVEVPQSLGLALLFRVGDALVMDLNDALRPRCVYRTSLNTPIPIVVEPDGDVEGFIAASALLELQDPRMDTHKDDPMNVDSYLVDYKYIPKYVCSWSWEPETGNNLRMIFSMDTGEMFMYEILVRPDGPEVSLSDCLYQGLPCKSLLWVEGGFLAAIVEMGDGFVLKLNDGKLEYTSTIQNSAPILDMSVVDYHNEKHNQIFACCGVAPEGSLRIIRSGLSVERLVRTASVYQGVTDTWTIRMKLMDPHHSFLVLSFVEQTRVLSVGLSFSDVTDSVGFQSDVCTLACGLLDDGMLVQIHQNAVKVCLPTVVAHSEGVPLTSPVCASWSPNTSGISLGSVTRDLVVVATSNPCFLILLGVKSPSLYHYEVYEMHHVRLQNEVSCISLTQNPIVKKNSSYFPSDSSYMNALPNSGYTFVIGTHKPSVEVLSYLPGQGVRVHAVGTISLTSTMGTAIAGCIPQDVRLVLVDGLYVLLGLRNGMLLRFDWPTHSAMPSSDFSSHRSSAGPSSVVDSWKFQASSSTGLASWTSSSKKPKDNDPIFLQLIAIRRIGVAPVSLVPLMDSVDTDIIALSERPWLVQTARHSLSYISLSFQPSTHVTTVCSAECPKGLLFVSDNSLHLVEMLQYKSVNVQKFNLEGTPRTVLYHRDSRLLLVMRTGLNNDLSDICCIDPLSGSLLSSFNFELGEIGKCMDLVRVGTEHVLVVGTSLSPGPAMMLCGEAEEARGRLIVLCLERSHNSECGSGSVHLKASSSSRQASPYYEAAGYAADQISSGSRFSSPDDTSCDGLKLEDGGAWHLRLAYQKIWSGMVLSVCSYLNHYFLVSAGNSFYVCGFVNDNPQRVRRFASAKTRHIVLSLTTNVTRIAVGDGRDGVLIYSYHEEAKKLEQLYADPGPGHRLVADCILMDSDAAIVSDRRGSIAILTCPSEFEDNMQPEVNLTLSCSYYMGEVAMSIRKGSFPYKLPVDDASRGSDDSNIMRDLPHNAILAGTLLGSIFVLVRISREEYELLLSVQERVAVHPLTAPVLGNNHIEFRGRQNNKGVPQMLDGDLLSQFLELTSIQQEAVLALPCASSEAKSSFKSPHAQISVSQVVQLLERVHYALS